jgi:hypothetical protein
MRRALGAAVVIVPVVVLAGCGGGGGGGGGGEALTPRQIASAAQNTSSVGSLKADFTISGAGVNSTGTGVFNTGKDSSGHMTMKITANGRDFSVDTVSAGNVLYMHSEALSQLGLPSGKTWLKLDVGQIAQQRGLDLGGLESSGPSPASALAYLFGSGKVETLGTESVQGVDTTHYKVTVDLDRAATQASGSVRQSLRSALKAGGSAKQPVEVWVDGDGYVRKVAYRPSTSGVQAPTVTMELHDFGSPVTIKLPPSNSVVDFMTALQGG